MRTSDKTSLTSQLYSFVHRYFQPSLGSTDQPDLGSGRRQRGCQFGLKHGPIGSDSELGGVRLGIETLFQLQGAGAGACLLTLKAR